MPEYLRLYVDQCLRIEVADALRSEGHNVARTSDVGQARADDQEILRYAVSDKRIIVTLDEHFGDWVVLPLCEHFGVIRLKINPATFANAISLLIPFLKVHTQVEFQNNLVILSSKRERWIYTGRVDLRTPSTD
jgi:predicted nuclease of predicted toxin-antitoxin system